VVSSKAVHFKFRHEILTVASVDLGFLAYIRFKQTSVLIHTQVKLVLILS